MSGRTGSRVLVVDDHPVVRRGLVTMLQGLPWVASTAEAATVAQARRVATTDRPTVAVLDVGLPDGDGIELIAVLGAICGCRCLVLTMDASPETAQRALAAGAAGYLAKDSDPQLVIDAVATVADGGLVLGFDLAASLVHLTRVQGSSGQGSSGPGHGTPAPGPFAALTPRELDIARGVAQGLGNAQLARRTGLQEKTVRNVLSGLLPKVGARDRVHLALLARENHLDD